MMPMMSWFGGLIGLPIIMLLVLGVGATVALVLVTTYTAERKTDLGGHP